MIATLCALLFVLIHGCAGCDTVKYYDISIGNRATSSTICD